MKDIRTVLIELNRRLHSARARIPDTLQSRWFHYNTQGTDVPRQLRLMGRVCRVARQRSAVAPTPENLAAQQTAFVRLASIAADALYYRNYGPSAVGVAQVYMAIALGEAKRDHFVASAIAQHLQVYDDRFAGSSLHRHNVKHRMQLNIDEPWRHSGWDNSIRPHMLALASLLDAAPAGPLRDILAKRALNAASASVSVAQELVDKAVPNYTTSERLFRTVREYGNKSLIESVVEHCKATSQTVRRALTPSDDPAYAAQAARIEGRVAILRTQGALKKALVVAATTEREKSRTPLRPAPESFKVESYRP